MRYGLPVDNEATLAKKTDDPALLEQLAEIELMALRHLTNPPSETPKDRILAKLRRS